VWAYRRRLEGYHRTILAYGGVYERISDSFAKCSQVAYRQTILLASTAAVYEIEFLILLPKCSQVTYTTKPLFFSPIFTSSFSTCILGYIWIDSVYNICHWLASLFVVLTDGGLC
jgi:hypothetical protein